MQNRSITHYTDTMVTWVMDSGQVYHATYRLGSGHDIFRVHHNLPWSPAVQPHEFSKQYISHYTGTYFRKRTGYDGYEESWIGKIADITLQALPNAGPAGWTNLYNQAVGDLYDQLRSGDVGSGLDLTVSAAEAGQVRRMVGKTNILSSLMLQQGPRRWASNWLQYQYGIKPLMAEIYGLVDALLNRRLTTLARVRAHGTQSPSYYTEVYDGAWPGSVEKLRRNCKHRVTLECLYEIENTWRQVISGYTSLNPFSIMWELTRASFVVDWFYDVGGYLRAAEGACLFGTGFKEGMGIYQYVENTTGQIGGSGYSNPTFHAGNSSTGSARYAYKYRFPIGAFPFPLIPRFNVDLGSQQLLSAASLLAVAGFGTPRDYTPRSPEPPRR